VNDGPSRFKAYCTYLLQMRAYFAVLCLAIGVKVDYSIIGACLWDFLTAWNFNLTAWKLTSTVLEKLTAWKLTFAWKLTV